MTEMVSIIIPVYNERVYFQKCIDSIISQSYHNLEIVVVDDGSNDDNVKFYDRIAQFDRRIKVYHIENAGVSNARNFGISVSNGKWIVFVDSDDWLFNDAIEYLLSNKNNHSMVMADYTRSEKVVTSEDGDSITRVYKAEDIKTVALQFEKNIGNFGFLQVNNSAYFLSVWAKLYDSELIKNKQIKFNTSLRYCEDLLFNLAYLSEIDNVVLSNHIVYFYRDNPNSASHKNGLKIIIESEKMMDAFLESGHENIDKFCAHFLLLTYLDIVKMCDKDLLVKYTGIISKSAIKEVIDDYNGDYLEGSLGKVLRSICWCWKKNLFDVSYVVARVYLVLKNALRR